ncbi:MAG: PIN domain-containing protein [Imperialibacter sp.]|uniref:type II toxin-antitoxin system VapC family toxin n=1 Tax=Imperialibacter sp. TaxID=2038411 RepID=UPI0032EBB9C3
MKVLIDANVLVSVLNKEYPVFSNAARVLSLAGQQGFELYATPMSLAIAFYFSSKKSGAVQAKKKLAILKEHILTAVIDDSAVNNALTNKSVHDFEDGMQYFAALEAGCQCIVTEDRDDFYYSTIDVVSCEGFLKKYYFNT